MNSLGRYTVFATLLVLTLAFGVVSGVMLDRTVLAGFDPAANLPADAPPSFELIAEAWHTIERSYVDRPAVEETRLAYGAITGMVDALGDTGHSRFLSPEMLQRQHEYTAGEFEGIGAYVESRDGFAVIVAPIDNSPAQRAGLQPGDVILAVNGQDMAGIPLDEVVRQVLGPAGTEVTLTILTPSTNEMREITLERARIALQNVTWQQAPGTTVAHVRISAFSEGVSKDLQAALKEIQAAGLTGVVLDLRNNPGGLLDEAIGTASQFLSAGEDVLLRQNAQGEVTAVSARSGGVALEMPVVVLINQGSASASEIVAGALQDNGRAQLVGETSFGTGTVLREFGLSDGSALLLATEQWLTPDGRVIWHQGVTPDVLVELPVDGQLLRPEAERGMTAEQLQASGDEQLLKALELLRTTVQSQ